jgi:hypothetical protein
MKLPAAVRIGIHKYKIVKAPIENHGELDDVSLELRLTEHFASDAQEAETVLHETLHALWNQSALQDGDDEERIIYAFSLKLADTMRQNKTLFRAILKALK